MVGNGHNGSAEGAALRWAQILGDWDVGDDTLVYRGGSERYQAHGQTFPMGLIVSNRALQHGRSRVT
jgi:hypothetical protein